MANIRYTLAICTHNHADHLRETLKGLRPLQAPEGDWELLIIDNHSSDETPAILAQGDWHLPGIANRVVREERLGVANARNRAVLEAQGEYVVFLDDDETPEPDWLRAMERHINAHGPDAVGGPYRVLFEGAPRPPWLQDELLPFLGALDHGPQPMALTKETTPFWTGNSAFRKATLLEQGLFDPDLGRRGGNRAGGEDTEMYRRLLARGCNLRWAPDAVIHHRIRANKLSRRFFLDLHFEQGKLQGGQQRGAGSRFPPAWVLGHLAKAAARAIAKRLREGRNHSLRTEMNLAYFAGFTLGWAFAPRPQPGDGEA